MAWLKTQLKKSTATFKFISSGSQVLCKGGEENLNKYNKEFEDLMSFIVKEKIEGVIFFSGDRHFTDLSIYQPNNGYPLYDATMSSLCSPFFPRSIDNDRRMEGTFSKTHTFGYVTVQGPADERECVIQTRDIKGNVVWEKKIKAEELTFKR
jgi:alkaline phosphatase D